MCGDGGGGDLHILFVSRCLGDATIPDVVVERTERSHLPGHVDLNACVRACVRACVGGIYIAVTSHPWVAQHSNSSHCGEDSVQPCRGSDLQWA